MSMSTKVGIKPAEAESPTAVAAFLGKPPQGHDQQQPQISGNKRKAHTVEGVLFFWQRGRWTTRLLKKEQGKIKGKEGKEKKERNISMFLI